MIYRTMCENDVSLYGFGAMRLPLNPDGTVDEVQTEKMVDYAMAHGVNYYDTAWPYHSGTSETIMGRLLAKYPRDSFCLADKYPGHQISASYNPAETFEKQLKRCQVEYFDFYLLHNIYENSLDTYLDPRWDILNYFREQKKNGRIKHLGFSTHAKPNTLRRILEIFGDDMEFCQIQMNYLDWTLQDAKSAYEMLTERGIPIVVMEPLRGGRLANLSEDAAARLAEVNPEDSPVTWAFRFLEGYENVKVVLSGASSLQQLTENITTFQDERLLTPAEQDHLLDIAETMKNSVPCTACGYCKEGCPLGLDIPTLLGTLNDVRYAPVMNAGMHLDALPAEKQPSACIACGKCSKICPQAIDIPAALSELAEVKKTLPKWADICRQREAEQK